MAGQPPFNRFQHEQELERLIEEMLSRQWLSEQQQLSPLAQGNQEGDWLSNLIQQLSSSPDVAPPDVSRPAPYSDQRLGRMDPNNPRSAEFDEEAGRRLHYPGAGAGHRLPDRGGLNYWQRSKDNAPPTSAANLREQRSVKYIPSWEREKMREERGYNPEDWNAVGRRLGTGMDPKVRGWRRPLYGPQKAGTSDTIRRRK